jgi:hypothetical protein
LYYGNEAAYQYYKFADSNQWVSKYCVEPYKYLNKMNMGKELFDQYTKEYAEYSPTINTAIADFAKRSWNGEIANLSTEWEQYINQLYSAGLEAIVDKYYNNEAFKPYIRPEMNN